MGHSPAPASHRWANPPRRHHRLNHPLANAAETSRHLEVLPGSGTVDVASTPGRDWHRARARRNVVHGGLALVLPMARRGLGRHRDRVAGPRVNLAGEASSIQGILYAGFAPTSKPCYRELVSATGGLPPAIRFPFWAFRFRRDGGGSFGAASASGLQTTPATCPGDAPGTRMPSGSARSCFSRRRSPP